MSPHKSPNSWTERRGSDTQRLLHRRTLRKESGSLRRHAVAGRRAAASAATQWPTTPPQQTRKHICAAEATCPLTRRCRIPRVSREAAGKDCEHPSIWRQRGITSAPNGRHQPIPLSKPAGRTANSRASCRRHRTVFHASIIAIVIATAFYAAFLPGVATTGVATTGVATTGVATTDVATTEQVVSLQPASEVLSFSLATIQLAPAAPPPPLVESAGLLAEANDYLRISALQAGPPPPRASSFAASEPPPAPAGPPCDTSQSPIYCVYTVQEDDTLSGIAAKFGLADNEDVASWELLVHSNKPDIVSEDDLIQIGQKLRIPQANGVIHTVLTAQTLSEIAEIYDTNMDGILAVTVNGITDADALIIGQELIVPDPSRFFKPAPPPPPVQSGGLQPGAGSQQSHLRLHLAYHGPDLELLQRRPPARHRHRPLRRAQRADLRGRLGHRYLRWRQPLLLLRLLRRRRPRQRLPDALRPLLTAQRRDRSERLPGRAARLRRQYRLRHRQPPSLRSPHPGQRRQPAALPALDQRRYTAERPAGRDCPTDRGSSGP